VISIDAIIVYRTTEEQLFQHPNQVLSRFREFNVSLNPDKPSVGLSEIEYVGHTISGDGIKLSQGKGKMY
jgi:hypothetical protein